MSKSRRIAMVVAGVVMELIVGVMYTWSIFRVQLASDFPDATAAQFSLSFTIAMICYCIGGFLGGKLSAAKNQRFTLRIAAILQAAGLFIASLSGGYETSTALMLLHIGFGVLLGLGCGAIANSVLGCINPWFPEKVGLISGILLMGTGLGSVFLGMIAQALFPSVGAYSMFRIFMVCSLVIVIGCSFVLVPPPKAEKTAEADAAADDGSVTTAQMLARPSFWIYFVWNIILASSGMLVINSAANIAVYYGAAAVVGLIVSLANGGGRPVIGVAVDKLGQFGGMTLMNCVLIFSGALLLVTAFFGSVATMIIGMIGVGICYGGGITVTSKVIYEAYGPRHYAVNFSVCNFCMIPAAFIGPYISGVLQDRSGGAYTGNFYMLIAMAVVALLLTFALKAALNRENKKAAAK